MSIVISVIVALFGSGILIAMAEFLIRVGKTIEQIAAMQALIDSKVVPALDKVIALDVRLSICEQHMQTTCGSVHERRPRAVSK